MNPMTEPRRLGRVPCLRSDFVGRKRPDSFDITWESLPIVVLAKISPTPKTPMMATIGSMPSRRVKLPKVKRERPGLQFDSDGRHGDTDADSRSDRASEPTRREWR